VIKSCNELQSRKDSVPVNFSSSTKKSSPAKALSRSTFQVPPRRLSSRNEKIRASLKSTNLETLRQVEAIGKAVAISVAPMASTFFTVLFSIDVVEQNANNLNQYHFMLEMCKLAVSAAAYRGDGLLLDYFLPDSYLHRTQERVNSIIKYRVNAIGPIYQPPPFLEVVNPMIR